VIALDLALTALAAGVLARVEFDVRAALGYFLLTCSAMALFFNEVIG